MIVIASTFTVSTVVGNKVTKRLIHGERGGGAVGYNFTVSYEPSEVLPVEYRFKHD